MWSEAFRTDISNVTKGAADFNRRWTEVIRANTNSTLDFVQLQSGALMSPRPRLYSQHWPSAGRRAIC